MSDKDSFDLELTDGRKVIFDLTKLKIKEWREYVRMEKPEPEDDDAIIAKTCDLTKDEIGELNFLDYRMLIKRFSERTTSPLPEEAT